MEKAALQQQQQTEELRKDHTLQLQVHKHTKVSCRNMEQEVEVEF